MSNKPLNISESAAVQMPMKTVASLIVLVGMGVFAYTELTSRLVSLETSRELFENDLLKKSEQVPTGIIIPDDKIIKPEGSYWDSIKDDYKKENPDIKLMGDKFIGPKDE